MMSRIRLRRKPKSKSYTDLVDLLSTHFNPTPSVIMQHFKFNTRTRKDNESVATYVAELKHLGEYCEFGDKLNEMCAASRQQNGEPVVRLDILPKSVVARTDNP